ncbi:hypothetical protein LX97_01431 [Nonlabens dokdonensis]|uniref:tRNA modification GTPase n=2 Tax=Nonlabens dokdonensis TaxID=328515 RepID=L7W9G0_NONDD|nr:tRNA modification GTPase [Nonlabens dokdonensis]AGC76774.1 TRNA modification GTPase [Nonlabens dokdonensis DSW-6]PZX44420.1 hypothetical protein LX97_01431 [Nonlabens dokdonensis]
MKNIQILFIILAVYFSQQAYAQISFKRGYFINNSNQRTECLIRDVDWKNNPTEFDYKSSDNDVTEVITMNNVKEFGIYDISKYVRSQVQIDRSSSVFNLMDNNKEPNFKEEEVFLKVLLEGDANLYSYNDKSLNRYFFNIGSNDISQLIYKKYKTVEDEIGTNNDFRRQLFIDLKCSTISVNDVEDLGYYKSDLLKLFKKYNSCKESSYVVYGKKKNSNLIHLNVRPGLNSSSLSIKNDLANSRDLDYGTKTTVRIGLELELILGFNNNKWAIILEPTYQYYNSDPDIPNRSNTEANYQSIEFPIGLRHYLFLNEKSKAFVNGSFLYDFPLDSQVRRLDVSSDFNLAFGIGYKYSDTYSLELRYHTSRDLLRDFPSNESDYNTISIIFGYSIF